MPPANYVYEPFYLHARRQPLIHPQVLRDGMIIDIPTIITKGSSSPPKAQTIMLINMVKSSLHVLQRRLVIHTPHILLSFGRAPDVSRIELSTLRDLRIAYLIRVEEKKNGVMIY